MGRLGQAFEIAFAAHAGQRDKSGAPYIAHVVRVASRLTQEDQQIVALLHDVVEDTDTPLTVIRDAFGAQIAAAVDAISHRPDEPRADYIARVRVDPLARAVKLADIADNSDPVRMALLPPADQTRLREKYARALDLLKD